MARTRNAQASKFNGVAIGGLADVECNEGFGRVVSGALDGMQGAAFSTARGDKFVNGTITHQDVEKMITLLTAAPAAATSEWYEAEVGAATFEKHALKFPVFGAPLNFTAGIGAKAQVSMSYECRFPSGEDFKDVHAKSSAVTAATVAGLLTVPISAGDPVVFTFDPGGAPITVAHLSRFQFTLGGRFVTDSDPGSVGREAVDFEPGDLTFSVTYRDTSLATGQDKAEVLFARSAAALEVELEVLGSTADTKIKLNNALFDGDVRRSLARGYIEFTLNGRCNWAAADGTLYTLGGGTKIIVVTDATFPA